MARRKLDRDDLDFVSDPRVALEHATPLRARALLWLVALFVVLVVWWADRAVLDEVTTGQGTVIPSGKVQVVQNLEGGIVSEILVREGETVQPGQVLIRIDDTRFAASFRERQAGFNALQMKRSRLQAEADGDHLKPPHDLEREEPEIVAREQALFDARAQEIAAKLAVLRKQATQRRFELSELQARLDGLHERQALLAREQAMVRPLVANGAASEIDLLRLERSAAEVRAEIEITRHTVPRIRAALQESEIRAKEVVLAFRSGAREELNAVAAELEGLGESAVALEDRVQRTQVRAPVRGTVQRLLVNTIGGVIQPGSNLVEIVPLEETLLIEARIRPSDIAFLHPGQPARVKITAYDFLIFGQLDAVVDHISADTIRDEEEGSFYLIRVRTDENFLSRGSERLPIIPGMLAEVDILTGKKSLLHYLFKPVLRAQQTAMRER